MDVHARGRMVALLLTALFFAVALLPLSAGADPGQGDVGDSAAALGHVEEQAEGVAGDLDGDPEDALIPTPTPTPTPTATPTPTPTPTATPTPSPTPTPTPTAGDDADRPNGWEVGAPPEQAPDDRTPRDDQGLAEEAPDIDETESRAHYVRSPGLRSTADILDALGPDADVATIAETLAPFPVAGSAHYSDDWLFPRFGPGSIVRVHEGVDIFAERGTPVIAAGDGVVTQLTRTGVLGGVSLWVTRSDGTYFYYAHLEDFAGGVEAGTRVSEGDVLGYVGSTGNAVGTPPHLHFEVHPDGGPAAAPVAYLDAWLAAARERMGIVASPRIEAEVETEEPSAPEARVTLRYERPAVAQTDVVRPVVANERTGPSLGSMLLLLVVVPLVLLWRFTVLGGASGGRVTGRVTGRQEMSPVRVSRAPTGGHIVLDTWRPPAADRSGRRSAPKKEIVPNKEET